MELWATGFNAWGNVSFDEDDSGQKDWQDLPNFTRVLRDESIEVRALYKSTTLGKPFDQFALIAPLQAALVTCMSRDLEGSLFLMLLPLKYSSSLSISSLHPFNASKLSDVVFIDPIFALPE